MLGVYIVKSYSRFCRLKKDRMLRMSNSALLTDSGSVLDISDKNIINLLRTIFFE